MANSHINNYIFLNKRIGYKSSTVLKILLMSVLVEYSWSLISDSAFNLLWCVFLVEKYEENTASHRYVVGKQRSILVTFI